MEPRDPDDAKEARVVGISGTFDSIRLERPILDELGQDFVSGFRHEASVCRAARTNPRIVENVREFHDLGHVIDVATAPRLMVVRRALHGREQRVMVGDDARARAAIRFVDAGDE